MKENYEKPELLLIELETLKATGTTLSGAGTNGGENDGTDVDASHLA